MPSAAKLAALSIGYQNQRTRMARLERLTKLIRFCEEVACKNVDVTDLLIVLSESTITLQSLKYISADDLRKFDALVDEYDTVLPIEVGSAKDQQSFWAKFNSKKKSRAAIEKLNGRMTALVGAAQAASDSALTAAVSAYSIAENVEKIMTSSIPNLVRAPRAVLGAQGISSMMGPAPGAARVSSSDDTLDESAPGGNTTSDDGEHYVHFDSVMDSPSGGSSGANTISGESATPLPAPLPDDDDDNAIPVRVITTRPQVGRIVVIPTRNRGSGAHHPSAPSGAVERSTSSTGGPGNSMSTAAASSTGLRSSSNTDDMSGEESSMSDTITVEPLSPRHYSLISPRRRTQTGSSSGSVGGSPLALPSMFVVDKRLSTFPLRPRSH